MSHKLNDIPPYTRQVKEVNSGWFQFKRCHSLVSVSLPEMDAEQQQTLHFDLNFNAQNMRPSH